MHRFALVPILLATLSGCTTEPDGSALIGPDTVMAAAVPPLSARVYQREVAALYAADSLLDVLLRRQIDVLDLWSPLGGSPCRAMCATANVIVALGATDDRIRQYGFDTSAGSMCINCGVERFIHYRVAR